MPRLRPNTVKRKLADGTEKVYRYEGGKAVPAERPPTVADLILTYKKHSAWTTLAPESQAAYLQALAKLDELRPVPLSMVDTSIIEGVRENLSGTPAMANITLAVLQMMFKIAKRRKWVENNPVIGVERFEIEKGKPWPQWAVDQFRTKCSDEWLFRFDLALLTAQRRGDLVRARWDAFDGVGISFHQQKTGGFAYVPVPQIVDELNARRKVAKGLTIITRPDGRPYSPDTFSAAWHAEMQRIGLGRKRLTLHGLRHTALTLMAENGATEHQLAAVSGHQNLAEVRTYTQQANKKKLAASAVVLLPTLAKRQNIDPQAVVFAGNKSKEGLK